VRGVQQPKTFATELPHGGLDLRAAVEAFENALILQALERTGGNKNQAARLLGLNRTTLVEMLKRKGLGTRAA
jgi:DNA-binding NtrC family response regulator